MTDPSPAVASRAASTLSRRRWGHTRTDRLVAELRERADQLGPVQRAELRLIAEMVGDNDETDGAA